jgi:hypothetical protein
MIRFNNDNRFIACSVGIGIRFIFIRFLDKVIIDYLMVINYPVIVENTIVCFLALMGILVSGVLGFCFGFLWRLQ